MRFCGGRFASSSSTVLLSAFVLLSYMSAAVTAGPTTKMTAAGILPPMPYHHALADVSRRPGDTAPVLRQVSELPRWFVMPESYEQSSLAIGKRRSFGAWSGKRDSQSDRYLSLVTRLHSLLQDKISHRDLSNKRQQFSAWAGKRSPLEADQNQDSLADLTQKTGTDQSTTPPQAMRGFNRPWKRTSESEDAGSQSDLRRLLNSIRDANVVRRAFSAWSGKRGFSAWAGKRSDDGIPEKLELF
ncbi:uncharacterized protein LOC108666758 [Hyalella azteca]|uniref:Uncharacterized protein LOC108666758 n=1 Tax=Hyalella azteca TaxID=294128 RepID=A0A8B7N7C7_HYAAZ|nr:uncharacterized protein LOC108666758 [Hyalella azteca]